MATGEHNALSTEGHNAQQLTGNPNLPVSIDDDRQALIDASLAENTRIAYRKALLQFIAWGGRLPATVRTIEYYITVKQQELAPSTIALHLAAISKYHRLLEVNDPTQAETIKSLMRGARREAPPQKKAGTFSIEKLASIIDALPWLSNPVLACRDRALLLVSYFGAFRRSELVEMQAEHLTLKTEGAAILLPRSKTDQDAEGRYRHIARRQQSNLCPVNALEAWLEEAGIESGPVFRAVDKHGHPRKKAIRAGTVNYILKRDGASAGLDPDELSGHSFRRSFVTECLDKGVPLQIIMQGGGWTNLQTMMDYRAEFGDYRNNALNWLLVEE